MSGLLLAIDAATVAVLAVLVLTLALTPAPREETFAQLARSFVAAMAVVMAVSVASHALAKTPAGASLGRFAGPVEMLWTPLVLLTAYAMLSRQQLESQRVAVRFFQRATDLVGVFASASPSGLLLLDSEGHIVFANEAAMTLLELTEDPDLGSVSAPGWELRMQEDSDAGLATLAAHAPLRDAAVVVEWPGNRRRRLCVNTLPMMRADGTVCGVLAAFADTAPWLGTTGHLPARA